MKNSSLQIVRDIKQNRKDGERLRVLRGVWHQEGRLLGRIRTPGCGGQI